MRNKLKKIIHCKLVLKSEIKKQIFFYKMVKEKKSKIKRRKIKLKIIIWAKLELNDQFEKK